MHRLIINNELVLYGDVGDMWGDGTGFSGHDVLSALSELHGANELNVRLNSGGGLVFDGMAIYNALKAFPAKINMKIDGIAASAASVIAMAGDEITMGEGAMIMIHDPSGVTFGTATDHQKTAAALDKMGEQAASIYANRTGMPAKQMRAMMLTETWLDGEEAVEFKFVDKREGDPANTATMVGKFDYRMYSGVPPHIAARGQRDLPEAQRPPSMKKREEPMPTPTPAQTPPIVAALPPVPVTPTVDVTMELLQRGNAAKLSTDKIMAIVQQAAGDLQKGTDLLLEAAVARDPSPTLHHSPGVVTADATDKFKLGVQKALEAKAGIAGGERNEFSGMTLRELARETLTMVGDKRKFSDPMALVAAAFQPRMAAGMHSTSDFVEILGNTANKSMLIGFEEMEETYPEWTGRGTLSDFKIATRVDLGLFPNLSEVPEGAEYHYATMSDRKVTLQLATYGKMFAITRQAIINDDLSAFTRVPNRMGRASKRTIGNLVYAQLTGNVTLDDGVALFHSTHANLAGSGGAITVETLSAGRVAMGKQTDPDSIAAGGLNLRPSFLLVPLEYEDNAKVHMSAQYDPTASTAHMRPNPMANMAKVISDARLSTHDANAWYLVASPQLTDTIEVLYLNGVETPTMEQRDGWNVDGVEFKVRMDTGVKTLDHRGLYKNAGP